VGGRSIGRYNDKISGRTRNETKNGRLSKDQEAHQNQHSSPHAQLFIIRAVHYKLPPSRKTLLLQPLIKNTPPTYDPRKQAKAADCSVPYYHQPLEPPSTPNSWTTWDSKKQGHSSGKKKNLFANLTFANRMLLCRISDTTFHQPDPSQPSPSCWDIFNESTSSKIPTHVLS
jgi:hypothetical protein